MYYLQQYTHNFLKKNLNPKFIKNQFNWHTFQREPIYADTLYSLFYITLGAPINSKEAWIVYVVSQNCVQEN